MEINFLDNRVEERGSMILYMLSIAKTSLTKVGPQAAEVVDVCMCGYLGK